MEIHVTGKGQVVIPAILRRKYGVKEGTRIIVSEKGNSIVLKPMTEEYPKMLQGSLKSRGGLAELLKDKQIESH